ncbi:MAG: hypothetical protein D6706_16465, partial [Chloroflexi bacterium]
LEIRTEIFSGERPGTIKSIDLANGGYGIFLQNWQPSVNPDEVTVNTSLADFAAIRTRRTELVNETLDLALVWSEIGGNGWQSAVNELHRFLTRARMGHYVWLAYGTGDTATRFALITDGNVVINSEERNRRQTTAITATLTIQRYAWCDVEPATTTDSENVPMFGNLKTATLTQESLIITSEQRLWISTAPSFVSKPSHIFINGTGSNLIGSSTPYTLFPTSGSVYFGVSTSVSGNAPVIPAILINVADTTPLTSANMSLSWSYWDGGAWTPMNTSSQFSTFFGSPSTGWQCLYTGFNAGRSITATTVNGVHAYWLRADILSASTTIDVTTDPIFPPESIVIEPIPDGDMPVLAEIELSNTATNAASETNQVVLAYRSQSRRYKNVPHPAHLIFSDDTSSTSVWSSYSVTVDTNASFQGSVIHPCGREIYWSGTGNDSTTIVVTTTNPNYYGEYIAYLVASNFINGTQPGQAVDETLTADITVKFGSSVVWQTEKRVLDRDPQGDLRAFNLGNIVIPTIDAGSPKTISFEINIRNPTSDAIDGVFHELILLPADEFVVQTAEETPTFGAGLRYSYTGASAASSDDVGYSMVLTSFPRGRDVTAYTYYRSIALPNFGLGSRQIVNRPAVISPSSIVLPVNEYVNLYAVADNQNVPGVYEVIVRYTNRWRSV